MVRGALRTDEGGTSRTSAAEKILKRITARAIVPHFR
jgi:hypothetical protein